MGGAESSVEEPQGPALEEWLLPLSRKAAQLVQDPTLGWFPPGLDASERPS